MLPIPAHPAYGTDFGEHTFDCAAGFTRKGDWRKNRLPVLAREALKDVRVDARPSRLPDAGDWGVRLDTEDAAVTALKQAHRGSGLIVRIQSFGERRVTLSLPGRDIEKAFLADALERDIKTLPVEKGEVAVPLAGALTTVRLLLKE